MAETVKIVDKHPKLSPEEHKALESALQSAKTIMDKHDLTTLKLSGGMDVNRQRAAD